MARLLTPRGHQRGHVDAPTMARSLALLAFAAATLVLVALALPGTGAPRTAFLVPAATYILCAILVAGASRLPARALDGILLAGIGLTTAAVHLGGTLGSSFALFYVWVALWAFCNLAPRRAALHMAVIAAACALVAPTSGRMGYWVLTVGTGVVTGAWVERLVSRVAELGRHDALTTLPNRRWWAEELPRALAQARRHGHPLSVIMLDIDHFKLYNDEHGHQAGDRFLAGAAAAWAAVVREGDALARVGGEEFAALLPHCALSEAVSLADRLRAATPHERTCSAGVAQWDRTESADDLLGRADAALYTAKRAGRDRAVAAEPAPVPVTPAATREESHWRAMVRDTLEQRTVDVAFQPIVDVRTRAVVAYEALARPRRPGADHGVIALFDMAERLGHGRDLDWLCRRAAIEHARGRIDGMPLFVNVGAAALLDPLHDVDQMLMLLRWGARSPTDVVLELTERDSITDTRRLAEVLAVHRAHGIRFALDDVGTGRATLGLLAAAVPEFIKLGSDLVAAAGDPGPRAAILAARTFAVETGAELIAKGVEDEDSALRIARLGVRLGQGYWLGRPRELVAEAV